MSKRAGVANDDALSPDFLDFIACLNEQEVDFVLVGGYALAIHGVVRATDVIDFLYRRTKATVRRLCAAMKRFGAPPNVIDEDALMTPDIVTQFGRAPYRIDLLSAIDGVSFAKVWTGATTVKVQGQAIRVIGLADLRTNKTATGRPKDAEDARKLLLRTTQQKR